MDQINIGKYLCQERKKRKLTQKEFCQGVISVSQYSRVESEEQDLRATTFLKLLQLNRIDINIFLNQEDKKHSESSEEEELHRLAIAFYSRDLKKVEKIKTEAMKNDANGIVFLDAVLIENVLKNRIEKTDSKIIEKLSKKLSEADNWNTNKVFLQMLGSSMMLFSIARLNIYMKSILKKYTKEINQYSFEIQRRIGSICINYLNRIYKEKNTYLLKPTLELLDKMSPIPDLLMYKLLGKYFEALFTMNKVEANSIKELLCKSGYEKFVINLP
ncbi:transcriptional regulator with XRE-family HTH domain [Lactobacillus colini]|uniref:Transcriptional regulator with XRE-family HTH domain n=1 Tax=Lactobacillus colini TaxID=1819254 RepID=A0ABS4MFU7_9LACO|nr:helix-turn-helix transcriptional regulator [Lactobacillus colini]MBP2058554.1 transcriptional regulator with XRE-family HTH domain [Lactobacillus colini]